MTDDALTDAHIAAWARMVRATQSVIQAVEDALKRAGLPPLAWYDLLLELRRADPAGLRPVQLQDEMLVPQSNMSRLLDRVEAAGHIARQPCDDDGRGQIVRITTSGQDLLRRMWPVYREVLARRFALTVPEAEARHLAEILAPGFAARRG